MLRDLVEKLYERIDILEAKQSDLTKENAALMSSERKLIAERDEALATIAKLKKDRTARKKEILAQTQAFEKLRQRLRRHDVVFSTVQKQIQWAQTVFQNSPIPTLGQLHNTNAAFWQHCLVQFPLVSWSKFVSFECDPKMHQMAESNWCDVRRHIAESTFLNDWQLLTLPSIFHGIILMNGLNNNELLDEVWVHMTKYPPPITNPTVEKVEYIFNAIQRANGISLWNIEIKKSCAGPSISSEEQKELEERRILQRVKGPDEEEDSLVIVGPPSNFTDQIVLGNTGEDVISSLRGKGQCVQAAISSQTFDYESPIMRSIKSMCGQATALMCGDDSMAKTPNPAFDCLCASVASQQIVQWPHTMSLLTMFRKLVMYREIGECLEDVRRVTQGPKVEDSGRANGADEEPFPRSLASDILHFLGYTPHMKPFKLRVMITLTATVTKLIRGELRSMDGPVLYQRSVCMGFFIHVILSIPRKQVLRKIVPRITASIKHALFRAVGIRRPAFIEFVNEPWVDQLWNADHPIAHEMSNLVTRVASDTLRSTSMIFHLT